MLVKMRIILNVRQNGSFLVPKRPVPILRHYDAFQVRIEFA